MAAERLYTWGEVADRIEAELGIRVAQHVLITWRRHDDRRRLLTESMTEPFHTPGHGARVFRADEVDDWLAMHPQNPTLRALDRLVQLLRTTQDRREPVAVVPAGGSSFEQISEALSAADGIEHHPDLVHRTYCPRRASTSAAAIERPRQPPIRCPFGRCSGGGRRPGRCVSHAR